MNILLISNSKDIEHIFSKSFLEKEELKVLKTAISIKRHSPAIPYDLIYCDLSFYRNLPFEGDNYCSLDTSFGYDPQKTKIILLTSKDKIQEAMAFVRSASLNYLTYPLNESELLYSSQAAKVPPRSLVTPVWIPEDSAMLRSSNSLMQSLYEQLKLVSIKSTTVLITGETGTGKGVAAQLIHNLSNRRDKPFISVHCGALPESLLESELFGHEKGAFTGANKLKKGKFELAQGGTIFLDEIGTVSLDVQVKLLQVLQEKKLTRVGGESSLHLDIRVVAATNEDLLELCSKGSFRRDLYYRLNVFPIHVPPLRERGEDLPLISSSLIYKFNQIHGKSIIGVDPFLAEALQNYSWPGNIRELENLFERAFILEQTDILSATSFPAEILAHASLPGNSFAECSGTLAQVRQEVVARIEEEYIRSVLSVNNGSIKITAATAGITTRQLNKLMNKYKINKNEYKTRT